MNIYSYFYYIIRNSRSISALIKIVFKATPPKLTTLARLIL